MGNLLKGNKLYSIFTGTCPVCHRGDMYITKNPYNLSETLTMYKNCSHCGQKFKIEPSFFFGAMYVSYAVGIAVAVAAFIIVHFFMGAGLMVSFWSIIGALIVLFPIILRISRNIWINFFLKYDPEKAD